jgi:arabinan endo-1,5-alpha-L-arabinosidase
VFGVLHSRDLINWREAGAAMEPLPGDATCYWAPEAVYYNGQFLLYYSVGNEERMQIRVAVADHPAGPFRDSGRSLTSEDFAIDPHVFEDDDGTRYLFYATDFLTHTRVGTGTAVDRMLDAFTLEGKPRAVTRPRFDWQIYDPNRLEKGGARWHTVEGPFVLKHKGLYYEMFSGGNWKNVTYGVSYAVSDAPLKDDEWSQACDGERAFPILRTLPGKVIGPGHNSVVRGPDNRQLFCVYHRWNEDGASRVLSIDPLDWAGERMIALGPSVTAQPSPIKPSFADFFDEDNAEGLGHGWERASGRWAVKAGAAIQDSAAPTAEAICKTQASHFVMEVSLRALRKPDGESGFGVSLYGDEKNLLSLIIFPNRGSILVSWQTETGRLNQEFVARETFNPNVFHLLHVEVDGPLVSLRLDDSTARWQGRLSLSPSVVALVTQSMAAAFSGFAYTIGWEDIFMQPDISPYELGWQAGELSGAWRISEARLVYEDVERGDGIITKGPLLTDYEMVVNARLGSHTDRAGRYGFYPASGLIENGPLFTVERSERGYDLVCREGSASMSFALPEGFDPLIDQQFRFRKQDGRLAVQWEAHLLGEVDATRDPTRIGLYAHKSAVAFDIVRVTAIG